ncbi:MAG: ROK family protein [Flavobacteriaceae bacterium]|nr:ROK family protein [Flavobacteriaceae bacterium]
MGKDNTITYAIGIDLGGTFVKAALVSNTGDIIFKDKLSIGSEALKENILDTLESIIRTLIDKGKKEQFDIVGVGIGTPGIVYEGVVLGGADNLQGWKDINLSTYFSNIFDLPVLVENDANVMGLGEMVYGAAKGSSDVIFITVGTGIGGAIFINGELYGGYKNRGGELGHITIDHNGLDCNCGGGKGCLEAYASTSALVKQYADLSGKNIDTINGHYIVKKFNEKEEDAIKCMKEHTDYLGHGIAAFINTFAPQKVVIGGGISEAGQFYIDMIAASAINYAMDDCSVNTEILGAKLGNDAGCLGASSLILKTKPI